MAAAAASDELPSTSVLPRGGFRYGWGGFIGYVPGATLGAGIFSGLLFRMTAALADKGGIQITRIRTLLVASAAAAAMWGVPQIASADIVGVPGTPNCFGERISHGSSDHKLTPKARAAGASAACG